MARSWLAGVGLAVGLAACGEQVREEAERPPAEAAAAVEAVTVPVVLPPFPTEVAERVRVDLTADVAGEESVTGRVDGGGEGEWAVVTVQGSDASLVGGSRTEPVQVGGGVLSAGVARIDGLMLGGQPLDSRSRE